MAEGRTEPQPRPKPIEIRYPGFRVPIREITTSHNDVQRLCHIEKAVAASNEFADVDPNPTPTSIQKWLEKETIKRFDKFKAVDSSKDKVIGAEAPQPHPSAVLVAAQTAEPGGIAAYTLTTDHESPVVDNEYPKNETTEEFTFKEISYVTDKPDAQRDTVEMAEALQQSAMLMWEMAAGRDPLEVSGHLNPAEYDKAMKLQILAVAGTGDDEAQYRAGLDEAGFRKLGNYDEDGEMQNVYRMDLGQLMRTMKLKKEGPTAAPVEH